MADEDKGVEQSGNGQSPAQTQPTVNILTQYVKDLSFENPAAPGTLANPANNPKIEIAVNVNAKPIAEGTFEIDLSLDAKAKGKISKDDDEDAVIFAVDLTYGGVFRVQNIPNESVHPFVLIECPRLLFPFARQVVADATRNGGFPPLLIDPIDFSVLYRQRLAQAQADAAKDKGAGSVKETANMGSAQLN